MEIFNKNKLNEVSSGQALLVVLLVTALALTVVLSSVSRSITDISISETEEDSSRAFSAAEAGVEEYLLDQTTSVNLGEAEANVVPVDAELEPNDYRYPDKLDKGEEAIIWFVDRDSSGNFKCDGRCLDATQIQNICWGDINRLASDYDLTNTPAIQLTLYYDFTTSSTDPLWKSSGSLENVKIVTVGFDSMESSRNNGFIGVNGNNAEKKNNPGCKVGTGNEARYRFGLDHNNIKFDDFPGLPDGCDNKTGCLIMAKIKMLYNDQAESFGINISASKFPPQGKDIASTGTAGEVTRKVNVFKSFSEPLELFTGAIFSKDGLSKP